MATSLDFQQPAPAGRQGSLGGGFPTYAPPPRQDQIPPWAGDRVYWGPQGAKQAGVPQYGPAPRLDTGLWRQPGVQSGQPQLPQGDPALGAAPTYNPVKPLPGPSDVPVAAPPLQIWDPLERQNDRPRRASDNPEFIQRQIEEMNKRAEMLYGPGRGQKPWGGGKPAWQPSPVQGGAMGNAYFTPGSQQEADYRAHWANLGRPTQVPAYPTRPWPGQAGAQPVSYNPQNNGAYGAPPSYAATSPENVKTQTGSAFGDPTAAAPKVPASESRYKPANDGTNFAKPAGAVDYAEAERKKRLGVSDNPGPTGVMTNR